LTFSKNPQTEFPVMLIEKNMKCSLTKVSLRGWLCGQTDLPPWQQKIFSSMIATIGRQLKQSVNVFHSFIL